MYRLRILRISFQASRERGFLVFPRGWGKEQPGQTNLHLKKLHPVPGCRVSGRPEQLRESVRCGGPANAPALSIVWKWEIAARMRAPSAVHVPTRREKQERSKKRNPLKKGVRDHLERAAKKKGNLPKKGMKNPLKREAKKRNPPKKGMKNPLKREAGKETNRTRPKRVVRDLLKGEARKSPLKKEARKERTRARPKKVVKSQQKREARKGENPLAAVRTIRDLDCP